MKYLFSAVNNAFYPLILKDAYVAAGTWLTDGIEVDESVFLEFIGEPPAGKARGVGDGGMPAWVDAPEPTPLPD